jgi:hypothetical protein
MLLGQQGVQRQQQVQVDTAQVIHAANVSCMDCEFPLRRRHVQHARHSDCIRIGDFT